MKTFIVILFLLLPGMAIAKECVVSGCNQQCVEKGTKSDNKCGWTDSYGCYKLYSKCIELPGGKCGWKASGKLQQCLQDPAQFKAKIDEHAPLIPGRNNPLAGNRKPQ